MVRQRTQKRRRRENKTDYKQRLGLLKSGMPRIVIRRTNKYFIIQSVESNESRDKVIKTMTSKELIKKGLNKKFQGSLKSIPAGYLTGILFAKELDKKDYIIDLGLSRTIPKNRIYSVLKGLVDGGAKINANKKVFPTNERIKAEHLKEEAKKEFQKLNEKIMKK